MTTLGNAKMSSLKDKIEAQEAEALKVKEKAEKKEKKVVTKNKKK